MVSLGAIRYALNKLNKYCKCKIFPQKYRAALNNTCLLQIAFKNRIFDFNPASLYYCTKIYESY
jgi:hypothetical protein